jgi:hypothetical protein
VTPRKTPVKNMENEQGKEGITGTSVVAGFVYSSLLFIVLAKTHNAPHSSFCHSFTIVAIRMCLLNAKEANASRVMYGVSCRSTTP